jgi:hypothetical protein
MSLYLKAVHYGAEPDAPSEQGDERRVQGFLTGHGWVLRGSADLFPTGGAHALHFQVPRCVGVVVVGLLPLTAETASLFTRAAGPDSRVFYVNLGQISANPPRFAYLDAKIAELMTALGLRSRTSSPVIAVSQPRQCRLETTVPWSDLVDTRRS